MAKLNSSARNPIKVPRLKAADQPATRRILGLVRDELKEEIKGVRVVLSKSSTKLGALEMKMEKVDAQIKDLRSLIDSQGKDLRSSIDSQGKDLRSLIDAQRRDISSLKAMVHRCNLLAEEQNANNRIVLEGLQALWERQERSETA